MAPFEISIFRISIIQNFRELYTIESYHTLPYSYISLIYSCRCIFNMWFPKTDVTVAKISPPYLDLETVEGFFTNTPPPLCTVTADYIKIAIEAIGTIIDLIINN